MKSKIGKKDNKCVIVTSFVCLLLLNNCYDVNAGRTSGGSNRRTSSPGRSNPSSNTHVTKPSYNTAGNSDLTRLSYSPNHNAPPNHAVGSSSGQNQAPPIGWNVPKQQGPPPAYSASNPVGGARTNMQESPPAYRPNNAPPPNYGAASGSNVHTPITATNTQGVQSSYPQQSYHAPGSVPAGATYYPAGHSPPMGNYYPGGQLPAGASYYPAGAGVPHGATYIPAGSSLPAGATYYSSPPQSSSSGLGFGSGLAAGAIGGAILGHVLTPQNTQVAAPANNGGSGGDGKVIIINNGPPGSVETTQTAGGATVITTGGQQAAGQPANTNAAPGVVAPAAAPVPLAPLGAAPSNTIQDASSTVPPPSADMPPQQPQPGGIMCVPMRVNETDPADATKQIEVEKIACFPAPQQPPPAPQMDANNNTVPLAPMNPVPGQSSQQMQQPPSMQNSFKSDETVQRANNAPAFGFKYSFAIAALSLLYAFSFN